MPGRSVSVYELLHRPGLAGQRESLGHPRIGAPLASQRLSGDKRVPDLMIRYNLRMSPSICQ